MKERPIIFSGEMVRAVLNGQKVQTRRVIRPQPWLCTDFIVPKWIWRKKDDPYKDLDALARACPFGQAGSRLWVRETFQMWADTNGEVVPHYRADYPNGLPFEMTWRPSIHMPRWASRINLEVTGVRVERLQDIQGHDVADELGTPGGLADDFAEDYQRFKKLWDSLNAKRGYGWNENPWMWTVTFLRME